MRDNIGFIAVTTQEIWQDHPEKVLGTTTDFVAQYPNTARDDGGDSRRVEIHRPPDHPQPGMLR